MGSLYCDCNMMTSLEGCPDSIGVQLDCTHNPFQTLEHFPSYVGGDVSLFNDEFSDKKILTNKTMIISLMSILSGYIGGDITVGHWEIDNILNRWKNQGRKGIMGATKELIDLDYNDFAQV